MDRSPPPRRPFTVFLYGALGLALVTILFQVTDSATTASTLPDSTSTTTNVLRPESLATLVPGLTGTLQAVVGSEQLGLISWDAEGPLSIGAKLPAGRPNQIANDASGELLGVSILGTSSNTSNILVGSPSVLSDVGLDATSFAWHLTEPGSMAAISTPTDSDMPVLVKLRVESGIATAVEPILSVGPRDVVLAWGLWGFLLIQHESGASRIVLVDTDGTQVWARPASWAYASQNGDVLLSFSNNEIREFHRVQLNSGPADSGDWFELPSLGVTGISWSPDGEMLAVASFSGGAARSRLEIYDNEGNMLNGIPLEWRVWDVRWSPNGRFLVMPGSRESVYAVLFYDVEDERLTPVSFDHPIQIAAIAG